MEDSGRSAVPVPDTTPFEPVPVPPWPSGSPDPDGLEPFLQQWAASPPIRALAAASGWPWPDSSDPGELLAQLAELSEDWNFRGQRERNFIPDEPVVVRGRVVPDDLIRAAAAALGLLTASPVPDRPFSHLVVLSGLVSACVNRTHYAARLVRGGVKAETVAVLGAHRWLGGAEPVQASELGFGDLRDEADVIVAAACRAFGLSDPPSAEQAKPTGPLRPVPLEKFSAAEKERLYAAWAWYRWPAVDVLIVPSSEPAMRRANTVDQLRYWGPRAGIDRRHDVLLVTTQRYVPFQHLEALRVLGLERGCGVYACGVDAASLLLPASKFVAREYLQEIRSALLAAAALLNAARAAHTGRLS